MLKKQKLTDRCIPRVPTDASINLTLLRFDLFDSLIPPVRFKATGPAARAL